MMIVTEERLHIIYDEEASDLRHHNIRVTASHHNVFIDWLDRNNNPRATVLVENYGGPVRAFVWNTDDYDNDPTAIVTMVEDPDNYVDPPEDE